MKRLFLIGQTVAVLTLVWLSATATEESVIFLAGLGVGALVVVLTNVWLTWAIAKRQALWPAFTTLGIALGVIVSVVKTAWPLRLSFALNRPALEQLAEEVRAGRQPDCPVRIGLFVIKRAEMARPGTVCLWTELDPAGNTGFAQSQPKSVPLNLWSSIPLDEHWSLVAED